MAAKPRRAVVAKSITYNWRGRDRVGNLLKGKLDAANPEVVRVYLRKRGIVPISVGRKSSLFSSGGGRIKSKDLTVFARQLTTMTTAGVPIVQALDTITQGQEKPRMRTMLRQVKLDVEAGSPFATALSKHPDQFDSLFCSLVHAGEMSGRLDDLLEEIATYKEATERLAASIKKALVYPILVLVVAFLVTVILLVYVVPKFADLYNSAGAELPGLTLFVIGISDFMISSGWIIGLAVVLGVILFNYLRKRSSALTALCDNVLLKLPLIGNIIRKNSIARFASTTGIMLSAGVPIVDTLGTVSQSTGSGVYNRAVKGVRDFVAIGQPMNVALQSTGLFPELAIQMVNIGEESGSLVKMLGKISEYYASEVKDATDTLISSLEPMLFAFLGVIIGGLVLAMYMPIFNLASAF